LTPYFTRELSDIDIALLSESSVPVDWLSGLRERLEESMVIRFVDVLVYPVAGGGA